MYCSRCGQEIPNNSRFCNQCGFSICYDEKTFDADVFKDVYNEKNYKKLIKTRKPLGGIVNSVLLFGVLFFAMGAVVCIRAFYDNQYSWQLLAIATFWFTMFVFSLYSLIQHKSHKKIVFVLCILWGMVLIVSAIIGFTDTTHADRRKLVSEQYEEQFIGEWVTSSGKDTIIYSFYADDGEYKASCVTTGYNVYLFDRYTATGKMITLYKDGVRTKYYYSFEDGYLYMDGLEFEKID